jgi:putative hemolysin
MFDGAISLDKVKEILEKDLPVDGFDTLGGFILDLLGRIPKSDEKPSVEFNDVAFKVVQMSGKRIVKIQAVKK